MNIQDTGKPKVSLHISEVERLLSWLRCYPIVGREDERKSLEALLTMALSLSRQNSCAACGMPEDHMNHDLPYGDMGTHAFDSIPAVNWTPETARMHKGGTYGS